MERTAFKDKIVITGVAGNFPNSENVAEFYENLKDGKTSFSAVDPSWRVFAPDLPPLIAKRANDQKFDAGFFGVHHKLAEGMHQNNRKLLELSVEAVIDSGTNPRDLKGSKTGVFVASGEIEGSVEWIWGELHSPNFGMVGSARFTLAERISYHLRLEGPSVVVDSACSSSLYALDCALKALEVGRCDGALVCAVNTLQNPRIHLGYQRLGILTTSGNSNVFDDACNGYIRSEATSVIFVQKMQNAKRVYAEILNAKSNCDGFKKTSISYPSAQMMGGLFQEVYDEIGVDPAAVAFVECHVAGTAAGVVQELKAVEKVFCSDRKTPLLVGSVKANVGHSETASGLNSLIKILVGLNNNCILPYPSSQKINTKVDALLNGKVVVVTDRVTLPSDQDVIIGCNNSGFGGTNSHLALKHFSHVQRIDRHSERLVCFSARTMRSLSKIFASLSDSPTEEYLALLQNIFRRDVSNHRYRGFIVLNDGEISRRNLSRCTEKTQLCLVYTQGREDWLGSICKNPLFAQNFQRIRKLLTVRGVEVTEAVALQLAVTDVLKKVCDRVVFVESGTVAAAYAKEKLTLEDAGETKVSRRLVKLVVGPCDDVEQLSVGPSLTHLLGRLYLLGIDLDLEKLYPSQRGPVKAPFISPLLQWNHEDDWHVLKYELKNPTRHVVTVSLNNNEWKFLSGHIVDGRNLMPGVAYLTIAWRCYLKTKRLPMDQTQIAFEDVKFRRVTVLSKEKPLVLTVDLMKAQNKFEISEDGDSLVTGKIRASATVCNSSAPTFTTPSMNSHDVYKKLNLHGYNYKDEFSCIQETSVDGTTGTITWHNWTTFLDAAAHFVIISKQSDRLHVPTKIDQMVIDPQQHALALKNNRNLSIRYDQCSNTITAPGLEIRNLTTTPINKRPEKKPFLEVHKFVPYETDLTIEDSVTVNVQLLTENSDTALKVIEVVDSFTDDSALFLCPIIARSLENEPRADANLTIYSSEACGYSNITLEDKTVAQVPPDSNLVILSGGSHRPAVVADILKHSNCFVLSRETADFKRRSEDVDVVSIHRTDAETLVLLRRSCKFTRRVIEMKCGLEWLGQLQSALGDNEEVLLVAHDSTSGILGLIACLKQEVGRNVSCVFLPESGKFEVEDQFYQRQLKKGLLVNVFKDGAWGSYRHLPLHEQEVSVTGMQCVQEPAQINVCYVGVNAQGAGTGGMVSKKCRYEFSGTDSSGQRVMGVTAGGAFSNGICEIPSDWSMEEAATVPVTYLTLLYALLVVCRLKRGQSVLIHSGASAIGQAAVNIALHYGCNVFTTVDSEDRRKYLRNAYPTIPGLQIGNSGDTSFEQVILKQTRGAGVDVVIDFLPDDIVRASTRRLVCRELGIKYAGGCICAGVDFDAFSNAVPALKQKLITLLQQGVKERFVKPLPKIVSPQNFTKTLRFFCGADKVYVLVGGLGGFGLELAEWLVGRGAQSLVLVSRNGVTTGYQRFKLGRWTKHGCKVLVAQDDLTTEEGCVSLVRKADALGTVDGVFNLSVVLHDALIENQSKKTFETALEPKALITRNMDVVTRRLCPNLSQFVVFSSVSCGRGNSGQTNYATANSIMERICEQRKKEGYPALAIQWGLIGDVGLVADKSPKTVIGGFVQQSMSSCLDVMDSLLTQNETIVSSSICIVKNIAQTSKSERFLDTIANILDISNVKHVSAHSTLSKLGMDSASSVQLKQFLGSEHSMHFSLKELRNMTLYTLMGSKNSLKQ